MWPILSSFIVHLVKHLLTHHPFCAEGLWQDVKSFKALAIPFPLPLSRDLVGCWGLCLHCAPWLFLLHSSDASSYHLVGRHWVTLFSSSLLFMTTTPKSLPDGCSAAVLNFAFCYWLFKLCSPPFQGIPWVVMFSCLPIAIDKLGNSVCITCLSPLFWLWLTTSEKLTKWDVVEKILAERRKGKRMGKAGMEIRVLGIEQVWHVGYNQLAWLALTGILTATRRWVWEEETDYRENQLGSGPKSQPEYE